MNKKERKLLFIIIKGFLKKSKKDYRFTLYSIAISVWGLIIITSIINGFDQTLIKSITDFYPHIITNYYEAKEFQEIEEKINFDITPAFIMNNGKIININILETDNLTPINKLLNTNESGNNIIGNTLMNNLNLKENKLKIYQIKGIIPIYKEITIDGVFKSGVSLFDSNYIIQKNKDIKKYTGYYIKEPKKALKIKEKYFENTNAMTWQESNESLMKTVQVDSYLAFIITFFIFLMTGFTTSNSITYSILNKKKEIGIFNSLGMKKKNIKKIFLYQSQIIALFGYLIGMIFGLITVIVLNFIKIPLPISIFYLEYLPININIKILIIAFIINVIITYIFSFISSKIILKIDTIEAIRNDD
ncbi:ABC transporter permease [Oceanotoga teriensis]|jgi:lipoprotein-releasing system permease protein|uniref:Lipoprotein-releasing system permease protein n=1 Tax=Oceanotoga teriensis TaxID=515440 RepID=A0AA45C9G7_9BACT|nr:FtsX-like permease family protein [Oceanotoga teriensis]MDO7975378.1 FtsX-like permease family protein [Oceanotoga teriensis]PWJ96710.1 lipoprotein-releasing system permease protein [Oceanotoga teriensis]